MLLVALAALGAVAGSGGAGAQDGGASEIEGRIVVRPWVDDDGELTRVEFGFRPGWGEDVRGGDDGPDDLFPPKRFLTQRLIDNSAGRWLRSSEILIPDAEGAETGVRGRIIARAEVDDDGELTRIGFGFRPAWGEDVRGEESGADDIFPTNRFLTRRLIDESAGKWLRSSLIAVPAEQPEETTEPSEGEVSADGGYATTEDGATIVVPAGAAAEGAQITARVVPAEELPPLPPGGTERLGTWDFEVEGGLTGEVTLSLPLPDEDETWFLGHYDGEHWYVEPFRVEDGMIIVQTDSLSGWEFIQGIPILGDVVQGGEYVGRQIVTGVTTIGEAVWDGITWTVDWGAEKLGLKDPIVCNRPDDSVNVTNPTGGGLVGIYLKGCAQQTANGPRLVARNPRHIWFEVRPIAGGAEYATSVDLYKWLSSHDEGTLLAPGAVGDWRPTRDGTVRLNAEMSWTAAGMTLYYDPLKEMIGAVIEFAVPTTALTNLISVLLSSDELTQALAQWNRGNREAALRTVASVMGSTVMRDALIDLMIAAAQHAGVTIKKAALIKAYALYKVGEFLVKRAQAGVEFFKVLVANDEERLGTVAYAVPRSVCWGADVTEGTLNGRWNHACQSQRLDGSYARYHRFELDEAQEVALALNSSRRFAVYVSPGTTRTANPVRVVTGGSDWDRADMEAGVYTIEVVARNAGATGRFDLRVEYGPIEGAEDDESDEGDGEPEALPPVGDGSLMVLGGTRDLYQAHIVDGSRFKRLILNSVVFNGYGFQLGDVRSVEQAEFDRWSTTDLARLDDDERVWRLIPDGSEGVRRWLNITAEQFEAAGFDWDAVISINQTEFYAWREGPPITAAELGLERDDNLPVGESRFSPISVGRYHSCALRETGAVECWINNDGQASPPAGRFSSVSAGDHHSCGLRETGAVECWINDYGQTDAPAGRFSAVSVGDFHSCGLRETGAVECWGANRDGQTDAPTGRFSAVSAGALHTCGLRETGAVECWGSNGNGQTDAPTGRFSAISAGLAHTCGLRESGAVECWGDNGNGQTDASAGQFSAVSAGTFHTCGLRETGAVECWGANRDGQTDAPTGRFSAVSAGLAHTCGLRETGAVECWGANRDGQTDAPAGRFSALSAGEFHSCGLRETGAVECWGSNGNGQTDAPTGRFSAISAGLAHICGLRETGAVECWGWNFIGQTDAPAGQFSAVSAGLNHTCGLRETGAVECWGGAIDDGETDAPAGRFSAVSVGAFHTCGLRETGAVECWGDNGNGQTDAPAGRFSAVSAGAFHTCGLRETGAVECWGGWTTRIAP